MPHGSDHQTSFERGLNVLIAVARNGQTSVADLADELDIPASTVYRYIRSLRQYALIEESRGEYLPGWRLMELSGQSLTHTKVAEIGGETLRTLSYQTSETAVLAVRAGTQAICLRQVISPEPEHHAFRINELLPLYAGAGQRVLLAFAPSPVVDIVSHRLVEYTPGTPKAADLLAGLAEIRQRRYAVSRAEFMTGALAVSVPVWAGGELVCSLTVAGPTGRCDSPAWLDRARRLLRGAAESLGAAVEGRLLGP